MAKVWSQKSLIEKMANFNFLPMRNSSHSVFVNDAAQDRLSYLLCWANKRASDFLFLKMRFISMLEWRQPMKITVNIQFFDYLSSSQSLIIAWMWNPPKEFNFASFFYPSNSNFIQSHCQIKPMLTREKKHKKSTRFICVLVTQEDCYQTLKIDPINRPVN